jgi:hypothetical protein
MRIVTCFMLTTVVYVHLHMVLGKEADTCHTHHASLHMNLSSEEILFGSKVHTCTCIMHLATIKPVTIRHMKIQRIEVYV